MYFLYVFLFLSIFGSTCFGCYCTHPQEHNCSFQPSVCVMVLVFNPLEQVLAVLKV
jgi:hypothetical protein